NSRANSIGFTDAEFKKIEARFDEYQYDCKAPEPVDANVNRTVLAAYFHAGDKFMDCGRLWSRRASELRANGGNRAAAVSDADYGRMTPDQQERVDYLYAHALGMYIPLSEQIKSGAEEKHRDTVERLMRLD